ncbi:MULTISPECIES: c-type cytochrome [unclassified Sphingomonas]|uniref:c-type cytochrome n=1 Tax=unclassified Sphingomonas TaxID=196159 RepID=UPI000A66E6AE|nr:MULTISPECIES: c-type cytochrome [unclassified Sphingomonas]
MKFLMGIAIAGASATVALLATATPTTAQTPAAAPAAFNACKACHTVNKGGRNGIGPNLNGVVGRPAASVAGFNYSPAMKASKLRWDAKTLDEYLAGPTKKVPGTRMPIATPDAAKRAAVIAYLTSAK